MTRSMHTLLCLSALAGALLAAAPARADSPPTVMELSTQQHTRGQHMIGAGVGIQAVSMGFALFELVTNAAETDGSVQAVGLVGTWVGQGVGAGYAPFMTEGFRLRWDDGSPSSRLKGVSVGLLQAAAHTGAVLGVHGLSFAIAQHYDDVYRAQACAVDEGNPACWEGPGPAILYLEVVGSHAIVATGFLISGLITAAVAKQGGAGASASRVAPPVVHPIGVNRGADVGISGTF
ncbi:MAG: hypothetical protein GY898_03915 [Proteobacteria bacterium]|nr:hypothetical protein [Pseudomonadota bacterium]